MEGIRVDGAGEAGVGGVGDVFQIVAGVRDDQELVVVMWAGSECVVEGFGVAVGGGLGIRAAGYEENWAGEIGGGFGGV